MLAGCPAYTQTGYIVTPVTNCVGTIANEQCIPGYEGPSSVAVSCNNSAGYFVDVGGISTQSLTCTTDGAWPISTALSGCIQGKALPEGWPS